MGLRFLAEAGNGEYVFIELGSASGGRDAKTVWLISFHTPPLETPAEPLAARWTRWVYNCDAWTGFPDSDVYLNPSYVMFGGVVPEPGVIAMPEGTVGRLAIDAVCNGNFLYPEGRAFTTIADAVEVVDQIASVPPQ